MVAVRTPEQFDVVWDREDTVGIFSHTFDEDDPSFDVGQRKGTASATVPTAETNIAAED